ncbi:MAG: LPXTG cell wall anchor domain-containing protein, partial [Peptococcaceae bacterium]|nr:LPXTG cell wall anchor domain-containing protein [Peptococcaceae bacterium]
VKDPSTGAYRVATEGEAAVYTIEAGSVVIKGLDDSIDYYLYETKAPDGYNKIDEPVQFKIEAKYSNDGSQLDENSPVVVVSGEKSQNGMKIDVVNNSGATLPETGGIGTTIFYVVGGALVLGAAVLLVTRRRMAE